MGNRYVCFAIFALLLVGPGIAIAAADMSLTPHRAEYKVKIKILSGELSTELVAHDGEYTATHRIDPTGLARVLVHGSIEESATFAVDDHGIVPLLYRSADSISSDKTQADVRFDTDQQQIVGTVNQAAFSMPFSSPVHDRVSIQYELMLDLLRGAIESHYVLFDIDQLKILQVENIGRKTIKVPAGEFEAVGIQHQTEGSSRVTTLWCVPELDYVPAIIEQHRKGKLTMRATLTRYQPLEPTDSSSQLAITSPGT